jgi:hypothetical protein
MLFLFSNLKCVNNIFFVIFIYNNMTLTYSQYLRSRRCCQLEVVIPPGPNGPLGPTGIGPTGATGAQGLTGATGRSRRGPTGPTGGKSFIINHPTDNNKYLVHFCLEGPEAGIYYRGKGEIINNEYTEVKLPDYVDNFSSNFTVKITPIYNNKIIILNASEVENNKFKVYGENSKFYWVVYGNRYDIDVEPDKISVNVKGEGPYLYI